MKILNPTDLELDAAFAAEVAGYRIMLGRYVHRDAPPEYNVLAAPFVPPRFTQSADLVLPYLYKRFEYCELQKGSTGMWMCVIGNAVIPTFSHSDRDNPAKCIVIALLRASGIEVEFSQ